MPLFVTHPRPSQCAARLASFVLTLASLASCNAATTTDVSSAGHTLGTVLSTDSVVVSTGTPAVVVLTAVRGGGFANAVNFSIDTLPKGITAAFAPALVATGSAKSILTLSVGSTAVAGTSSIRVIGSGFGVAADTMKLKITVTVPAIALSAGASAVAAPIGGSASIPLTFTRSNGYSGTISLVAEGVPDNVTATFAPALVSGGMTSSTLTLTPVTGATIATSTITVRAHGVAGVADQTASVQFGVTSGTTSDYSLSASTAAVTLVTGAVAQTVIALNRTGGFTGNATLSISGVPVGVTTTFTPNGTSAATSALAFSATTAAVPGRYNLNVTSTVMGGATRTLPIVLTITVPAAVQVTLAPATINIARLALGETVVRIGRVGGLVGDVVLSAEGMPTGVSVVFAPATLYGTATTSLVTLFAGPTAVAGTYTVVVRANGNAGTTGTSSLTIVITN
jgi:hypothetical protein